MALTQMALDSLDFDATVALAETVAPHVDILEIGTPCIKHNGIKLLETLKAKFPNNLILVDLKTMDAGEYEAEPFYKAGADICTVLGASGIATIKGVIAAAKKYGKECQVDMINVDDKESLAKEAVAAHKKEFQEEPGAFFLNAYSAALAMLNAIDKANSTKYEDIVNVLRNEYVATPLGIIKFDERGDAIGVGFSMYQVINGKYIENKK